MRSPRLLLPVVLCSTAALAGCGSSSLLDGTSAEELQASIVRVQGAVDEGRCSQAMDAATEGLRRVDDLPSSVDRELVSRLRQGFRELEQRIASECTPPQTTTTEPPVTTETTTDEEPPPVTTTEEQPAPTTTDEPTTTDVPPDTTTDGEVPLGDEGSGGTPPATQEGDEDSAVPRSMRELQEAGREARKRLKDAVREAREALRGDR
jgi:hypothetical protein